MLSRNIMLTAAFLASGQARAETVTASWYGPGFQGRRTASGCLYDMHRLSAASRTLPLGTVLAVSRNGRTVRLIVNDRGPYVAGRGLDLSRGAAEALDMVGLGVGPVDITVLGVRPMRC
jgi:peptidoglycan lytic transglycosylase